MKSSSLAVLTDDPVKDARASKMKGAAVKMGSKSKKYVYFFGGGK